MYQRSKPKLKTNKKRNFWLQNTELASMMPSLLSHKNSKQFDIFLKKLGGASFGRIFIVLKYDTSELHLSHPKAYNSLLRPHVKQGSAQNVLHVHVHETQYVSDSGEKNQTDKTFS